MGERGRDGRDVPGVKAILQPLKGVGCQRAEDQRADRGGWSRARWGQGRLGEMQRQRRGRVRMRDRELIQREPEIERKIERHKRQTNGQTDRPTQDREACGMRGREGQRGRGGGGRR